MTDELMHASPLSSHCKAHYSALYQPHGNLRFEIKNEVTGTWVDSEAFPWSFSHFRGETRSSSG